VSAFQKLFLATAILATGLAVAVLLGQPVVSKTAVVPPASSVPQAVALAPPLAPNTSSNSVASVQLLPDADAPSKTTSVLDAPALLPPLAPISTFSSPPFDHSTVQFGSVSTITPPRSFETSGPVVHLRNEAPRAVGSEARSPITVRRLPPVDVQTSPPPMNTGPSQIASVWASPPTNFNDATNYAANTPAIPAAYTNTAFAESGPQPLPSPLATNDSDDSQTHVVADGDSLEKLAALYLSDPHRGKEIFELNRDILSDPNLLPIGAELKIPDRVSRASTVRQSRRPGFQGDANVREAAMGDLVPVRSLPTAAPPQAQLTPPVAAD